MLNPCLREGDSGSETLSQHHARDLDEEWSFNSRYGVRSEDLGTPSPLLESLASQCTSSRGLEVSVWMVFRVSCWDSWGRGTKVDRATPSIMI